MVFQAANTVESSTLRSEFIVMKAAVDQIEALCYKLRMMGVPISGLASIYCDNESVFKNCAFPESTIKKKHNAIAYHRTQQLGRWNSEWPILQEMEQIFICESNREWLEQPEVFRMLSPTGIGSETEVKTLVDKKFVQPMYHHLFQEQSAIGWNHLISGRFSKLWTKLQSQINNKVPTTWTRYTIKTIWQHINQIWKH
jgi:hypothetical protein